MSVFSVAPSVQYTERDATLFTKASVTIGAGMSGLAPWGAANWPTLVTGGEEGLVKKFFEPTDDTYQDFLVANDYLNYSSNVWFNRLVGSLARNAVAVGETPVKIDNEDEFETATFADTQTFIGRYPGTLGNSLVVAVADHLTFPTWDYKDSFEYVPGEGEFAVAVVDTTGVISKGIGVNPQTQVHEFGGSFPQITFDGVSIDTSAVTDAATLAAAYAAAIPAPAGTTAVVNGNVVEYTHTASGLQVLPTAPAFTDGYADDMAGAVYTVGVAPAEEVKQISTITITTDAGADGTITFTDGGSVAVVANVLNADGVETMHQGFASALEADANIESATYDHTAKTVVVVYAAGYAPGAGEAVAGTAGVAATVAQTVPYVAEVFQRTDLTFTYEDHFMEIETIQVNGVDVIINRGDTAEVVAGKVAAAHAAETARFQSSVATLQKATTKNIDRTDEALTSDNLKGLTALTLVTKKTSRTVGTIVERYELLSNTAGTKKSDGTNAYFYDVLNETSTWIYAPTDALVAGYTELQGGVDDYDVDRNTGFDAYKNTIKYDISTVIDSAATVETSQAAIDVCIKRRDSVAMISPPMSKVVNNRGREMESIADWADNEIQRDSSYFFMNDNWAYVWDKYNSKWRWIPCAGGTAGLRARSHALFGPWKSFAFYNRGQYIGYRRTAWSADLDERTVLYKARVNSISTETGGGIYIMGDKTGLTRPSAFDRINVRDTFVMMEKNISGMAKYFLGENNDEFTRGLFTNTVRPYIRDLEDQGAILEGRVKCDESNNTGQVIAGNQLKAGIWIKPQYSINWVWLDFAALRPDMSFEEIENGGGIASAG